MKITIALAAIVLATMTSAQVSTTEQVDQEQRRLAMWTEFLSTVAKTEDVCIVTPVTTKNWPPNPFARRYGVTSLWMLGDFMGTRYSIQDGTVAFQLEVVRPANLLGSGSAWVSDWLSTTSDRDIAAAISKDGLSLGSIGPNERLSSLTSIGLYGEVLEGFVANGSGTRLSVRFAVQVTGTDATGKKVQFTIDPSKTIDRSKEAAEPFTPEDIPADSLKAREGELDFGPGKLVTVKELTTMVEEKVKKRLAIDPRLDDSHVFLSGRYSFEKLHSALKYALTVAPVDTFERAKSLSPEEIRSLVENRLSAALADFTNTTGIDAKWAMEGRTMSASSISEKSMDFSKFLASRGLDPSSLRVTLVPRLKFNVNAPGQSRGNSLNPAKPPGSYNHNFTFSISVGNGK